MLKSKKQQTDKINQIFERLKDRHPSGEDPWGLRLSALKKNISRLYPIYNGYFKTRTFGTENLIPDENYIVVANHSGQIAIDGALICASFLLEPLEPRILRPMVERFFPSIPFVGSWSAANGTVLGDRQNCISLLKNKESVLVFPEGVRGIAKSTHEFYHLQEFTRGFVRIAIDTNTKILPVSVVGAEEMFPMVYHPRKMMKKLGLPAFPLSLGLLLGPLGLLPLPSPIDIHIGKPISIDPSLDKSSKDSEIDLEKYKIENCISEQLKEGIKTRRKFWGNTIIKKLGINKNV
ncbi:acyltransferase family protein [bacterium]|nr:acyltransferase family protein [bacterium]